MANDPWGPTLRGLDQLQDIQRQQQTRRDTLETQAYNRERQGKYDEIALAKGQLGLESAQRSGEKEGLEFEDYKQLRPQDVTNKVNAQQVKSAQNFYDAYELGGPKMAAGMLPKGMDPSVFESVERRSNGMLRRTISDDEWVESGYVGGEFRMFHHKPAKGAAAASHGSSSSMQEKPLGKNEAGVPMFQKNQYNPDTRRYDIPFGEPFARGGHGAQVDILTQEAINDKALLQVVGDKEGKMTGGRSAAAVNQKISNQASVLRKELGMDEGDTIVHPTEFKALGSSLVQQQKNLGSLKPFITNIQGQIDEYNILSKEIETYDARLMNVPLRVFRAKVKGHPLQSKLDTIIKEVSTELTKVSSGSTGSIQQASEGAREEWEAIHDKNLSVTDMRELLTGFEDLANIRLKSVEDGLAETKTRMKSLVTKPGEDKKVTLDMAREFLKRADGDKAKARQLAKDEGFTF